MPQKVELDDKIATTAARIRPTTRPMEEWFEDGEPYLLDFLGDDHLRQIADGKQRWYWQRRLDPTWTPKNKKKRAGGPYILWPLLVAKQDSVPLVGSVSGRSDHPVRIYRHKRGRSNGGSYGRVFNAEALERAVLEVLGDILRDWPELEPRMLAHAKAHIAAAGQHSRALLAKQEQRQAVRDQLLLFVRQLTPKTKDDLLDEIKRLEAQRDALDAEIEMLKREQSVGHIDPHSVVAAMKVRLEHLADDVPNLPPPVLADVLAALTGSLVADMETKETTFSFHLPAWMLLNDAESSIAQLCTRSSSEFSTGPGTQRDHDPDLFIPLASGTCRFTQHQRSVSCKCRRRAA